MSAAHTPGPWITREVPSENYRDGSDGTRIFIQQPGGTYLALCDAQDDNGAGIANNRANARLIAAAPALLAALRGMLDLCARHNWRGNSDEPELGSARAALAAAEGQR